MTTESLNQLLPTDQQNKIVKVIIRLSEFLQRDWVILPLIMIFGVILRLINIGSEPYWVDEIVGLQVTKQFQNFGELFSHLKLAEYYPPLYFIALHYWTNMFGYGEMAVRLLSVMFGTGVIILTYVLGKNLFPHYRVGLISASIVAILPIQIEYSQEARPYIIFCFFGLLAAISLWKYLESKQWRYLIYFNLTTVVGLYLHYSFVLFLAAAYGYWLLMIIYYRRQSTGPRFLPLVMSGALIFVAFWPWLDGLLVHIFLSKYRLMDGEWNISSARPQLFFESVFNQLIWLSKIDYWDSVSITIFFVIKLAFVGALLALLLKRHNETIKLISDHGRAIFFIIILAIVPIIFFIFTPQSLNYTAIIERHIIISSVFITYLIALLLTQCKGLAKIILFGGFCATILTLDVVILKDDSVFDIYHRYQFMGEYLNTHYRPDDTVIVSDGLRRSALSFYLDKKIDNLETFFPIQYHAESKNDDVFGGRNVFSFIETVSLNRSSPITTQAIGQKINLIIKKERANRVWLVGFDKEYGKTETEISEWLLNNQWHELFSSSFLGLELYEHKK